MVETDMSAVWDFAERVTPYSGLLFSFRVERHSLWKTNAINSCRRRRLYGAKPHWASALSRESLALAH